NGTRPESQAPSPGDSSAGDYGVIAETVGDGASQVPAAVEATPASGKPAATGQRETLMPTAADESSAHVPGESAPSVPLQATADETATGRQQPKRFPYENGVYAAQHLIHKMPPDEFDKMLDLLLQHRDSQSVRAG
ncbi:hypothetical protein NGM37_19150, partial [Streptomyces sp. TRM76130]|nr:hypothetical protein [Streptomyces sp. TRM76130]